MCLRSTKNIFFIADQYVFWLRITVMRQTNIIEKLIAIDKEKVCEEVTTYKDNFIPILQFIKQLFLYSSRHTIGLVY